LFFFQTKKITVLVLTNFTIAQYFATMSKKKNRQKIEVHTAII